MSKFERIVREPLVMGGQARVRDTGITVNEIVRLSLDGSSQAEILQKFPMLEAEDVHQALGYALSDSFQTIKFSRSDGVTPLTGLSAFVGILIRGDLEAIKSAGNEILIPNLNVIGLEYPLAEPLTPEKRLSLLAILQNQILQAKIVWDNLYNYATIISRTNQTYDFLIESANELLSTVEHAFKERNIKFDVQKLDEDCYVQTISGFTGWMWRLPNGFANIEHLQLNTKIDNKTLAIQMIIEGELSTEFELAVQPYFPIGTLAWLVYLSGGELKIRQGENSLIFEFALPIVEK